MAYKSSALLQTQFCGFQPLLLPNPYLHFGARVSAEYASWPQAMYTLTVARQDHRLTVITAGTATIFMVE